MSYAKKPRKRASAKKSQSPKRRRTRNGRGMFGLQTTKAPSSSQIIDLLKKGGLMVIGFLGGREIERKFLTDTEGFKKFLGPILQAGGGYVLARQKNESLRYLGYGMIGGGLISGAGKVAGKDFVANGFLNGIHGLSDLRGLLGGSNENPYPILPEFSETEMLPASEDYYSEVNAEVIA